ncbi:hypothetical protein BDV06DRAFT_207253 [Aspergillus oleicola]
MILALLSRFLWEYPHSMYVCSMLGAETSQSPQRTDIYSVAASIRFHPTSIMVTIWILNACALASPTQPYPDYIS